MRSDIWINKHDRRGASLEIGSKYPIDSFSGFRKSNQVDCEGRVTSRWRVHRGEGRFAVFLILCAQRRVLPPCKQVCASSACVRAVHLTFGMGRLHTFVVTLKRESRDINWGLRIVGGADLATPLIVTRVPALPSPCRPTHNNNAPVCRCKQTGAVTLRTLIASEQSTDINTKLSIQICFGANEN